MISRTLQTLLDEKDLSLKDFQRVVLRLLDRQVVCRGDSERDTECYDLYVRMEELILDYLGVLGIHCFRNDAGGYLIAYPPGSEIPGIALEDAAEAALQKRVSANEAALLLTLRLLFEEQLRAGDMNEEGYVYVQKEAIYTRFVSLTKREMPTTESERRELFAAMKRLKILKFNDLDSEDAWVGIREIILNFTLDGVVKALDGLETPFAQADADTETEET